MNKNNTRSAADSAQIPHAAGEAAHTTPSPAALAAAAQLLCRLHECGRAELDADEMPILRAVLTAGAKPTQSDAGTSPAAAVAGHTPLKLAVYFIPRGTPGYDDIPWVEIHDETDPTFAKIISRMVDSEEARNRAALIVHACNSVERLGRENKALREIAEDAASRDQSELAKSQQRLSEVLEDEDAESKDIRLAAINLCGELLAHMNKARRALAGQPPQSSGVNAGLVEALKASNLSLAIQRDAALGRKDAKTARFLGDQITANLAALAQGGAS